ncbi:nicotinate-nucleotide pyrophosphorylase (carboxylating) [Corynebacterium urealyticum DSM 7109]|uniref:Nicotinate-nucleotide pyrophosphorylase [carboxylating] n=2 Tax=Corynebacterium urealyticum TaxID=43771 RepID=B1VE46_CORU7|nr:putative nicotinate-nucleotide pyrophosphorylase [carboxylating] [Corynebacterium urealyticum DSM 7111]CAQ04035.1 nicotinate-nucleotide pyrophosphorylase (carboxylating) [Corynebacterium urealyticum DSM 7109]
MRGWTSKEPARASGRPKRDSRRSRAPLLPSGGSWPSRRRPGPNPGERTAAATIPAQTRPRPAPASCGSSPPERDAQIHPTQRKPANQNHPKGPMLTQDTITTAVRAALAEDAPWGDITSEATIPADARLRTALTAREDGVFAGGQVVRAAFELTDPAITVTELAAEGTRFTAGQQLAVIEGPARGVLTAERIALNFAQRMCAIATLTARYVDAIAGTNARIVDTRKTTPGLRAFEKHSVRVGGGHNHRYGLSDAVMVKDNHLAALTASLGEGSITEALRVVRSRVGHTTHIEVEVDRMDQIEPVLAAGVDSIMLDNFGPTELARAVALIDGRAATEASGNVSLETVAALAATGVDVISVGKLTHSAGSLDLGLDALEPAAQSTQDQAAQDQA